MSTLSWLRPTAFYNELVPSELALKLIDAIGLDCDVLMLAARAGSHNHNPYHNTLHELQHVYWSNACFLNSRHSKSCQKLEASFSSKSLMWEESVKTLCLASMFHDHNHSGGNQNDQINIDRAVKFVKSHFVDLPRDTERLIRVTQFTNGTFTHPPTDYLEECMRDADLMSIYSREGRRLLFGLFEELGGKSLDKMTDQEVGNAIKRNREFLKSAEMYTDFGRMMKNEHLEKALTKFEDQLAKFVAVQRYEQD